MISFHENEAFSFVLFSQGGVSQQTLVSQQQMKGDFKLVLGMSAERNRKSNSK